MCTYCRLLRITLKSPRDSTMNPSYCILNTDNSQNLFRATPILFWAPHVEFRTSQSEVHEKLFCVLFNLKDKFCRLSWRRALCCYICVNSETLLKNLVMTFMLRKNAKEILLLWFSSLKQRWPLMAWITWR